LDLIEETGVDCPYCGEHITLVLDLSVTSQDYIEDCFVCCQPMRVRYSAENGELINMTAPIADHRQALQKGDWLLFQRENQENPAIHGGKGACPRCPSVRPDNGDRHLFRNQ
jgi:hypothetical protein